MHHTDIQLSIAQARKLALLSQHLPCPRFGAGLKGVKDAIQQLGYVQIDTISVVSRAHHHTLYNRVNCYQPVLLDKLLEQRKVFEYWSHAASYLPISDYRYCLPRMQSIKSGERHWYEKNPRIMREVLAKIKIEGPLRAKDFSAHSGFNRAMWEWGPIKQAIEHLFMQGDLLVTRREGFQKVFDLAHRVIPDYIDTSRPSMSQYAHHLIKRYLQAHGIAHSSDFGYLRKGTKTSIVRALAEKIESGEIIQVGIKSLSDKFYVSAGFDTLLDQQRLSRRKLKILSPFDNLVIQRKRIKRLFNFDYQLECYIPSAKRRHGYFVLPILIDGQLVARMDAKAKRKTGEFIIYRLLLENNYKATDRFAQALYKETLCFAQFNQCSRITIQHCEPASFKALFNTNNLQ